MKTPLILMLVLLAFTAQAFAQGTGKPTEKPTEKPAETPAEEVEVDAGVVADFNAFIKREAPDIDAGGKHDIHNLKDPQGKQERHEYTGAMSRLILLYMQQLDMGSTIAKIFDQQSRGKLGDSPCFKVLHAIVMMSFPPGKPNTSRALELLREAADKAKDYAYPWYFIAQFEIDRMRRDPALGSRAVFESLDKAISLHADFVPAILLRCEVLLGARPPRIEEAKKLVAPYLENPPVVGQDFESVVVLQRRLLVARDFHAWVERIIAGKKVTGSNLVRVYYQAANQHISDQQFDDAIVDAEAGLALARPESDARQTIRLNQLAASCWSAKAMELQRKNPSLEGKLRTEHEQFVAAAAKHIQACAEIEQKWLPLANRGSEAMLYVGFLVQTARDLDGAVVWLENYLKATDLVAAQRYALENLLAKLVATIEGTDDSLITLYEGFLAQDDLEQLANALKAARDQARTNVQRFKTPRALKFFVDLLTNRERNIVQLSAFLAADTALQMTDPDRTATSKALADRHLTEIECQTDEQADLQADLADGVKRLGIRADQARVVRHQAGLIEALSMTKAKLAGRVAPMWADETFLKGLKDAPAKPSSLDMRSPSKAAAWLKSLADKLDADKPAE